MENENINEDITPVIIKSNSEKRSCFTPPTKEEVKAYTAERGSNLDPDDFIDFYESKGWMVGKEKMKDWKAACRRAEKWERKSKNGNQFLQMLKEGAFDD